MYKPRIISLKSDVAVQFDRIKRKYDGEVGIELSPSDVIEKILKDNELWVEKNQSVQTSRFIKLRKKIHAIHVE